MKYKHFYTFVPHWFEYKLCSLLETLLDPPAFSHNPSAACAHSAAQSKHLWHSSEDGSWVLKPPFPLGRVRDHSPSSSPRLLMAEWFSDLLTQKRSSMDTRETNASSHSRASVESSWVYIFTWSHTLLGCCSFSIFILPSPYWFLLRAF